MKYLKLFENFTEKSNSLLKYLEGNFPIKVDELYLSTFGKIRFYIMIEDKPSYFTDESGLNLTKNYLVSELSQEGQIQDERIDVPIVKNYLRTALAKNQIIWIHGLPGSGKSTLAMKIEKENKEKDFLILDDVFNFNQVEDPLKLGKNIILTSPYFENYSFTDHFQKLKETLETYDNYFVIELWFENDKESCIENLKNRKDHKINSMSIIVEMDDYSKKYKVPSGARTIPVYKSV